MVSPVLGTSTLTVKTNHLECVFSTGVLWGSGQKLCRHLCMVNILLSSFQLYHSSRQAPSRRVEEMALLVKVLDVWAWKTGFGSQSPWNCTMELDTAAYSSNPGTGETGEEGFWGLSTRPHSQMETCQAQRREPISKSERECDWREYITTLTSDLWHTHTHMHRSTHMFIPYTKINRKRNFKKQNKTNSFLIAGFQGCIFHIFHICKLYPQA